MLDRLEQIETRYEDLGRQLADPQIVTDQQKYHKTAKAHRDLEAVVGKYRELKQARQGIADAESMLNESDPEMAAMAQEELTSLEEQATALEEELKIMLLPKDPND
jgi:peptide chain release factor 1